jgi:hypothetical protein
VIEQTKQKNICYKCKEPWFPGHKKVCKMTQKAQIQALQADHEDIVYITEETDSEDDLAALDQELQLLMHAVWGVKAKRHTFTLAIQMGQQHAIALVDTGSTTTFMTPTFAAKSQCLLTPAAKKCR